MDKKLEEYRNLLIAADQKAQEDFDKTVLSLSGGALGISFAFVKDIIGSKPTIQPEFLLAAWVSWGLSVTFVLSSFYFSQQALRQAIKQVDNQEIYKRSPGGLFSRVTAIFNALGGLLFLIGVISMVVFVSYNLR
jgi:hypothetical protein